MLPGRRLGGLLGRRGARDADAWAIPRVHRPQPARTRQVRSLVTPDAPPVAAHLQGGCLAFYGASANGETDAANLILGLKF